MSKNLGQSTWDWLVFNKIIKTITVRYHIGITRFVNSFVVKYPDQKYSTFNNNSLILDGQIVYNFFQAFEIIKCHNLEFDIKYIFVNDFPCEFFIWSFVNTRNLPDTLKLLSNNNNNNNNITDQDWKKLLDENFLMNNYEIKVYLADHEKVFTGIYQCNKKITNLIRTSDCGGINDIFNFFYTKKANINNMVVIIENIPLSVLKSLIKNSETSETFIFKNYQQSTMNKRMRKCENLKQTVNAMYPRRENTCCILL